MAVDKICISVCDSPDPRYPNIYRDNLCEDHQLELDNETAFYSWHKEGPSCKEYSGTSAPKAGVARLKSEEEDQSSINRQALLSRQSNFSDCSSFKDKEPGLDIELKTMANRPQVDTEPRKSIEGHNLQRTCSNAEELERNIKRRHNQR